MFWGEAEKVDIFPSAAGAFSENQPSSTEVIIEWCKAE
jgi:hypothetical protein